MRELIIGNQVLRHSRYVMNWRGVSTYKALQMIEENKLSVISIAEFVDAKCIDGGDTLAMRFLKPGEQELVVLVPRQVAIVLHSQISEVLAQSHNPDRLES